MTKTELYANFAENIEIERVRLKLSQQKMADALGISLSKYKVLITNPYEANIDIYLAHQIQRLVGRSVRELCGDELPELRLMRLFRELPEHRQDAIRCLIETEHQLAQGNRDRHSEECPVTCFVPTGNMEDGMFLDSSSFVTIDIGSAAHGSRDKVDCAVKITSNHLHPVYMKGDVLLVSRHAPRDGDVGIFISKATRRMYIREFKQTSPCELRPLNDYGEVIYVDSDSREDMEKWIKFGTVIHVMR